MEKHNMIAELKNINEKLSTIKGVIRGVFRELEKDIINSKPQVPKKESDNNDFKKDCPECKSTDVKIDEIQYTCNKCYYGFVEDKPISKA